ncbi:MAG TPA: prepilin-type N-terminal cleavage/methylation domain-containing protein [Sedimentisphaerales bacterium]|nr:prepilin-type N-terminal cleavage/methylation domain-containing protein [Sedimentisphaerales bacterium]
MPRTKAFTLVEILIVVVLLALLAVIAVAAVEKTTTAAKESALAHDLQMLRRYILVYESQHLEVAPGYPNGQTDQQPAEQAFVDQITTASDKRGQTAPRGTPGFNLGPYLQRMPENPFNNKSTVQMLADGDQFPADADNTHAWIYKAAASEIRADTTGADESGKRYYDY